MPAPGPPPKRPATWSADSRAATPTGPRSSHQQRPPPPPPPPLPPPHVHAHMQQLHPAFAMHPQTQEEVQEYLAQVQQRLARNEPEMEIFTAAHISLFTPVELEQMTSHSAFGLPVAQIQQRNSHACGFIEALGARMGFPQRTICAAQTLFQRFHLFYSGEHAAPHEVSTAALSISAKMNDTYKRGRDILLASLALRFPDMVKTKSTATSGAIGQVAEADVDPVVLESERKRLQAVEKMFLESLCFNFHTKPPCLLTLVVKLGRQWGVDKEPCKLAWRLACDAHRTKAVLMFPSSVIAVATLYLAVEVTATLSEYIHTSADPAALEDSIRMLLQRLAVGLDSHGFKSRTPLPPSPERDSPFNQAHCHSVVALILDCLVESMSGLRTAFGSAVGISPRSPFDPSSGDGDPPTPMTTAAATNANYAKLNAKWASSPPPLAICWLCESFINAGRSAGDVFLLLQEIKSKTIVHAKVAGEAAGAKGAKLAAREAAAFESAAGRSTVLSPDDVAADPQTEAEIRCERASKQTRLNPFAPLIAAQTVKEQAAVHIASAAAAAATGTPQEGEAAALVQTLTSDKRLKVKRFWFEIDTE